MRGVYLKFRLLWLRLFKMAAKKGGAASNGARIHSTPISVDYFHRSSLLPSRMLYFLTHAHADHLYGLDSSFDQTIYCTSMTKQLLLLHISLDPDLLVELQLEEPRQIYVDCPGHVSITVTAIDAHHCPGSVMFLFQGYFGTILHTGDFRLTPVLLSHPLLKELEPDVLYLDNTYNNPHYEFPDRSVAMEQVTKLIVDNPHLRTFLAFNKIGKEELLLDIVKHTQYMIGVNMDQYKKMTVLGLSDICSLDNDKCQVIVVPFYAVTESNVERWTKECPSQVIIPTSRFIGNSDHPLSRHPSVTVVHYSDHCSYKELYQFVKLVKPIVIRPIVQRKDVRNISTFKPLCSLKEMIDYEAPSGVKALLYSSNINKSVAQQSPYNRTTSHTNIKRCLKVPKGVHFLSPKKPRTSNSVSNSPHGTPVKRKTINSLCSHVNADINQPILLCTNASPSSNDITEIVSSNKDNNSVTPIHNILDITTTTSTSTTNDSLHHDPFVSKESFLNWFHATAQQLAIDQENQLYNNDNDTLQEKPPSSKPQYSETFNLRDFITTTACCLAQEQLEYESFI